jgi:tRNA dimethylallyltransferase
MQRTFFVVGPTATGKSDLAADVANQIGAEIVSADAFQIYRGLDILTAKPDAATLAKVPHHLIGTTPLREEMNVEKYLRAASHAIEEIHSRGKVAIVVGGSGLYVKALTHGLTPSPQSDPKLREKLNAMSSDELCRQLSDLDLQAVQKIDMKNRRRVVRALEICLLTGKPVSTQREEWAVAEGVDLRSRGSVPPRSDPAATGIFVYRDREELYARINRRVETMFESGVIEEVRGTGEVSATATQMIGFREIHQLIEGKISISQPMAAIQQATRRYAKRQLTWFRRQTNFLSLNLSLLTHREAVNYVLLRVRPEVRKVSRVRAKE